MESYTAQPPQEVIALDADDHLARPKWIRLNPSEVPLFPVRLGHLLARGLRAP